MMNLTPKPRHPMERLRWMWLAGVGPRHASVLMAHHHGWPRDNATTIILLFKTWEAAAARVVVYDFACRY